MRQIEEALVKSNQFPLPPSLVERQLEGMMSACLPARGLRRISEKVLGDLKQMKPRAEDEVRLAFILRHRREGEDRRHRRGPQTPSSSSGSRKRRARDSKKDLREVFTKRKDQISHMIRERKTMAFLKDKAAYKDA